MPSEHEKSFAQADFSGKLDDAEALLNRLTEDEVETLENDWPDALPKLRATILALRPRIAGSDPLLVSSALLAETEETLTEIVASFRVYFDDGNLMHLNPLNDWASQLIAFVPQWPGGPDLPTTDALDVAARFRHSAGQHLRNLEKEFEEVRSRMRGFEDEVEKRSGEWGEERIDLELKIKELGETIDRQEGRLDAAIENYQEQFSTAQEKRSEEYRHQLSALESQGTELVKEAQLGYERQTEGIWLQANELKEGLEAELVKAKEIASFVGGANTGAGYGNEAKDQKKTADRLRWGAIAFGVAAAGLAVWAIIHAQQSDDPSVTVVLAKALGSLIFAGLAGYVATQSAHHRSREESARQRELDLLALPAIIATLPEDQKEDITGEVATRLFLAETPSAGARSEPALTKESISLISPSVRRHSTELMAFPKS
jgi:hypothetical protein